MESELDTSTTKHDVTYNEKLLETPLLYFVLKPFLRTVPCLRTLFSGFFSVRSFVVGYPLQIRFPLPKCLSNVPFVRRLTFVTVGEVLLVAPFVAVSLAGAHATFANPSVEGSGHAAAIPIYVAFLTASKSNSVFSFFLGVPFERMLSYHVLSGYVAVLLGCFHFYVAFAFPDADSGDGDGGGSEDRLLRRLDGDDSAFSATGRTPDPVRFAVDGGTNMSGTNVVLVMAVMILFSLSRRVFFQIFYYLHVVGAVAVIVFLLAHDVGAVAVFGLWWGVDVFVRYVVMAGCRYPKRALVRNLPADVVEISFPKTSAFDYNAGQYVFLAVPRLSILEWHPFSISSSPHMDTVTITVRVLGDWTQRLRALVENEGGELEINVLLEGPYGSLGVDLFGSVPGSSSRRYESALLVSGGVGVTPMQSICNTLAYQNHVFEQRGRQRRWRNVRFVWAVREAAMIDAMSDYSKGGNLPRGTSSNEDDGPSDAVENADDSVHPKPSAPPESYFSVDVGDSTDLEGATPNPHNRFLRTDYYLTKKSKGKKSNNNNVENDPFVISGRPDIPEIFRDMKKAAIEGGERRVAVCVCGPTKLVEACKIASVKHSDCGVTFDVHSEKFDF